MGAKAHNQHSPNQFIYSGYYKKYHQNNKCTDSMSPIYDKTIPSLVFFLHLLSNLGIKAYC